MLLTRSLKQKIAATCGAMFGFVLLYEVTMLDSKTTEARTVEIRETTAKPAPGLRLRFTSTAYCKGTTTASGAAVRSGIAAADPDLLPVGSVIQIDSLGPRYNGIYTIMDTGPKVQGRHIDVYMWSCHEALAFGRRPLSLNVLRLGWNPRASSMAEIGPLFKQRERDMVANDAAVAADLAAARASGASVTPAATLPAATAAPEAGAAPPAPAAIPPATAPAPSSSAPGPGATSTTQTSPAQTSPTQTSPVNAVARRSS
jgi:3D (Asp-Asp-Asp) domain-containing protein